VVRKEFRRRLVVMAGSASLLAMSALAFAGGTQARADATTTACTPDNNPAFGPSLDALDPCRADTGSPADDNADYSYSTAVVSHVEVPVPQTTVDAAPGVPANVDYVWVDYIRPAASNGTPVPTIMDTSPYYNTLGRGYDSILKTLTDPNAPEPVSLLRCSSCPMAPFPEWEAHYFVPRGYAVALMDLRGTRNSSGCEVYGDKQEALDAVAAIDWIVSQSWSNGKVGMIGGSYDGTLANGAAALYPLASSHPGNPNFNPDALAAVVPIRAIDRWYDYQFFNGVEANGQELDPELFTAELPAEDWPTNGDPAMGPGSDPSYAQTLAQRKSCPAFEQVATDEGYTAPYQDTQDAATTNFWNNRDFLQYASTWKAATLFIHGLFDENVKTMNSGQLWQALQNCGAPGAGTTCRNGNAPPTRYLWFNGAHADPDTPTVAQETPDDYFMPFTWAPKFEHEVHQWFLQFLKGVEAGALQAPKAEIQRDYDDPGDTLQQGHWDFEDEWPANADDQVLHFNASTMTADPAPPQAGSVNWDDEATGTAAPLSQSFVTAPFTTDTRISGQFEFDLNFAVQGTDTTLCVEVDDVPPGALNDSTFAALDLATNTDPYAFTFGYARAFYRSSINPRGASYPTNGSFLTPNQQYQISFPSTYTDYVLRAGHRLRFTFSDVATDQRPNQGALTVQTYQGNVVTMFTGQTAGLSQVRVPVAQTSNPPTIPEAPAGWVAAGPGSALVIGVIGWLVGSRRRRAVRRS
jgi:X-Pro dipeptidyl-peptidase